MIKRICCSQWIVSLGFLLLAAVVSSKNHGNQANEVVDLINKNRTSKRLPRLTTNPGLGCIALQYAIECAGNCTSNDTLTCRPSDDDFSQIFAPNCGVELPTLGTVSGLVVGCRHRRLDAPEAFSSVLVRDNGTLSVIGNRTHTEVGVGIVGKGAYVWCVLFGSNERNATFVLEDLGKGVEQRAGCYSGGGGVSCSGGGRRNGGFAVGIGGFWTAVLGVFVCFESVLF